MVSVCCDIQNERKPIVGGQRRYQLLDAADLTSAALLKYRD